MLFPQAFQFKALKCLSQVSWTQNWDCQWLMEQSFIDTTMLPVYMYLPPSCLDLGRQLFQFLRSVKRFSLVRQLLPHGRALSA
jgi:hypothetical protein